MALTLIKETGAGLANANSYATVAECDAFHEGHLYATAWTAATATNKAAALVMASRLIDVEMQFVGVRAVTGQALQWPRVDWVDRDTGLEIETAFVPAGLLTATCETARALLIEDRTANPLGEGLKFQTLGSLQQSFDSTDRRPVLPRLVLTLLKKYGADAGGRSGSVKLVRA
jgi:hypothetical protein